MPSINSKELVSLLAEKGIQIKVHLHRPSIELTTVNQVLEFMSRVINSNFSDFETLKSVLSYVIGRLGSESESKDAPPLTHEVASRDLMYWIGRFVVGNLERVKEKR